MTHNPLPRATSVQIGMDPHFAASPAHATWRSWFRLAMRFRQRAHEKRRWAMEWQAYRRQDKVEECLVEARQAWDCARFYLGMAKTNQRYPLPSDIPQEN